MGASLFLTRWLYFPLQACLCFQVISRSSCLHLLITILLRLCSCWNHLLSLGFLFFSLFFFCSCLLISSSLPSHNLTSTLPPPIFFSFPLPVKCVYNKILLSHQSSEVANINTAMRHSLLCLHWWRPWGYVFHSNSSLLPVTICFLTQWRPFLPGLKYEVIDSAYISLYTGNNIKALPILCIWKHFHHLVLVTGSIS